MADISSGVARRLATRDDDVNCGTGGGDPSREGLRIASVFIILIGSMFGAFFPVIAYRSRLRNVIPKSVFDFAKYFGSGVIIATAFIHLLAPALQDELGSPCLGEAWTVYPYALALCMLSIFCIFFVELFAFRWGSAKLAKLGAGYDPHGHGILGQHASHGPEAGNTNAVTKGDEKSTSSDIEQGPMTSVSAAHNHQSAEDAHGALAQIVGVFILEFGVLLHSVLIGLTLAVSNDFVTLFVVIIFHQSFEGLGLGSRLAYLQMPPKYNYVAYCGAFLYGITTPLGIAVGLGVRSTYNPDSTTASIVSGVLDSLSAGVLIYTGLVELLAHEFIFNKDMREASTGHLVYSCACMLAGAGLMALLGRWA